MDRTTLRGWVLAAASLATMVASVYWFVVLDGGGRSRALYGPIRAVAEAAEPILEGPDIPMAYSKRYLIRWHSDRVYWAYFTGDPQNHLLEEPWPPWGTDGYYDDPERIVCANQWVAAVSRRLALR